MGRRMDLKVLRACLIGLGCAYAQQRRLTWEQALARIGQDLDDVGLVGEARIRALSDAAASYVVPSSDWAWFAPAAADLLIAAGADRQLAVEIARERHHSHLTGSW